MPLGENYKYRFISSPSTPAYNSNMLLAGLVDHGVGSGDHVPRIFEMIICLYRLMTFTCEVVPSFMRAFTT